MLGAWDPAPGVVATCWLVMVAAVPATGSDVHPPPARVSEGAHIPDQATYEAMYKRSVEDPETFWGEHARKNLGLGMNHCSTPCAFLLRNRNLVIPTTTIKKDPNSRFPALYTRSVRVSIFSICGS